MLGVDSDNDGAFMYRSVFDYRKNRGLVQTRVRAYKKTKARPGSSKRTAPSSLAQLYASSRLNINFFQPSFKTKAKTRDGARMQKVYFAPATPYDRFPAHDSVRTRSLRKRGGEVQKPRSYGKQLSCTVPRFA